MVVYEMIESYREIIDKKQLEITVNQSMDETCCVLGSEEYVKKVITPIFDNAIKFTQKGRIDITLERINDYFLIAIADTGIGISENDQPKLFQHFSQVDSGLNREYGGIGLGTSVARRIVELLGGNIYFRSRVDGTNGTTFYIELPLKQLECSSKLSQLVKARRIEYRSVKPPETDYSTTIGQLPDDLLKSLKLALSSASQPDPEVLRELKQWSEKYDQNSWYMHFVEALDDFDFEKAMELLGLDKLSNIKTP